MFERFDTVADVLAVARRAQISILAAGLAYFAFTSLVPFVLLAVAVVTVVGGEALAEQFSGIAVATLGERLGTSATESLFAGQARFRSSLLGVGVLVWSGLRLFGSSDRAFAAVYDEHHERSMLETVRNAALVLVTNLLALTLMGVIAAVFGRQLGLLSLFAPVALLAVLVVVFLPMFYVFPRADVSVLEVLPGTAFAAGAWAVASVGLGVYAGLAGDRLYGAAGGVLLVLTWLYVGGLAVLFGATLNAVLGGRVDPDSEGVPTDYM